MPPNTKDLAINQTMVAYGNRQNATAFTRANNSDLLRSLKQLMETRLKVTRIHRCQEVITANGQNFNLPKPLLFNSIDLQSHTILKY